MHPNFADHVLPVMSLYVLNEILYARAISDRALYVVYFYVLI